MEIVTVTPASVYRREGDTMLIELNLHDPRQLFNSLDPSPFIEKDLDDDAEIYIIDAVRECGAGKPKKLIVHLPADVAASENARSIPFAIHGYFAYRAQHEGVHLRFVLREGLLALVIGLAFLTTCLALRGLLAPLLWAGAEPVIDEGLLIMGWVAMWRPIQTFLYDWWPIRRHRALLSEISQLPIEVRPR